MKIRLTALQTQRLRAFQAAHPEQLRSVTDSLDAAIRIATEDAWKEGSERIKEHDAERTAAWKQAQSDDRRKRGPIKPRRRVQSKITPAPRTTTRDRSLEVGARTAGTRTIAPSRLREREGPPVKYVHKPTDKKAIARAAEARTGRDEQGQFISAYQQDDEAAAAEQGAGSAGQGGTSQ